MTRLAAWRPSPGRFCSSSSSRTVLQSPRGRSRRIVAVTAVRVPPRAPRDRRASTHRHPPPRNAVARGRQRARRSACAGCAAATAPAGPVHPQAEASDRRRLRAYRGPPSSVGDRPGCSYNVRRRVHRVTEAGAKELPDTASASSSQTRRQLKPAGDFPDGPRRHQHPATGGGAGPRGNRGPARVRGELAHQRCSGLAAVCHFAKSILRLIEFPIATYPASLGCRWSPLS